MRHLIPLGLAALALTGCAANPEKRVAREAAEALTGSPWTLTAVGSITMEGTGTVLEPGSGKYAVRSFQRVMNFKRGGQWRQEEVRIAEPPADAKTKPDTSPQMVVRASYGKTAFNVNHEGTASTVPDQEALDRREELYHNPFGLLEAAFARNSKIGNTRTVGTEDAVDVTIEGITYTLYIDRSKKWPTRITSRTRNGESNLETAYSDYVKVHGYTLPSHIVMKQDQTVLADLKIDRQFVNADAVRLPVPKGIKVEQPAARGRGGEAAASF